MQGAWNTWIGVASQQRAYQQHGLVSALLALEVLVTSSLHEAMLTQASMHFSSVYVALSQAAGQAPMRDTVFDCLWSAVFEVSDISSGEVG